MIILNSLKSITVITTSYCVVIFHLEQNGSMRANWCGVLDFVHFIEICLK